MTYRQEGDSRATRSWSVAVHCTLRPARSPPAWRLVRPAKMIRMSRPNSAATFAWPTRSPSPAATMRVIDAIPQAIPNMVRAVRSLWARRVRRVSPKRSLKLIPYCKTILSPSLSPPFISVFTPFEIPVWTATLRRPWGALGSGTSTEALRSLS